jgi:uncharacterized DUF497 family protein
MATKRLRGHRCNWIKKKATNRERTSCAVIQNPEHSENDQRFVLLGLSISLKVLVVCYCYRQNQEVIRIVSASKA